MSLGEDASEEEKKEGEKVQRILIIYVDQFCQKVVLMISDQTG